MTRMSQSRRDFLAITGGVAVGCAAFGSAACHTNNARLLRPAAKGGVVTLALPEVPELATPGAALRLAPPGWKDTILLWRDAAKVLHATSITCTHLSCDLEVARDATHLYCPCHGSAFEATGAVRKGPAKKPLRAYAVRETAAGLEVRGLAG